MGIDDSCSTGLVLGLGLIPTPNNDNNPSKQSSSYQLEPSLILSLSGDPPLKVIAGADQLCLQTSSHSGASSFSNKGVSAGKKLRLTKEQSALLEKSFKHHSTLNPKQKQVLAKELNLRPRQVEVWFQNRRARTKLKQTEVDYEFLKKCCETLTDENMRLQKEIQELRTLKKPFYMHMPASNLTICPSCERISGGAGGGGRDLSTMVVVDGSTAKLRSVPISLKSHFFINPFTNPSATS